VGLACTLVVVVATLVGLMVTSSAAAGVSAAARVTQVADMQLTTSIVKPSGAPNERHIKFELSTGMQVSWMVRLDFYPEH
jgi:predicted phosphoribosyltransferase